MARTLAKLCAHCGSASVRRHCGDKHPTCTWARCGICRWVTDLHGRSAEIR